MTSYFALLRWIYNVNAHVQNTLECKLIVEVLGRNGRLENIMEIGTLGSWTNWGVWKCKQHVYFSALPHVNATYEEERKK